MAGLDGEDVSAVVCTLNSISSIERCLVSLRAAGVSEIIVVDAASNDGTRETAEKLADLVLTDSGRGLGNARNLGIAATTKRLILNMGSDNVMPQGQLQIMIEELTEGKYQGVSAKTVIEGQGLSSRGLNAWRQGRFPTGQVSVIGTPTLFEGDLLRANPYDASRRFSDDSELCERLEREHGATFGISHASVLEAGKTSWKEVVVRCRMYGISDHEVFRAGTQEGWSKQRQIQSFLHPARVDLFQPLKRLRRKDALVNAPFLCSFTMLRYGFWAKSSFDNRKK